MHYLVLQVADRERMGKTGGREVSTECKEDLYDA